MVRGVHHPQAIVLLHSHVSSENLWSLHESTMNDAILDSVPALFARAHACMKVLTSIVYIIIIIIIIIIIYTPIEVQQQTQKKKKKKKKKKRRREE